MLNGYIGCKYSLLRCIELIWRQNINNGVDILTHAHTIYLDYNKYQPGHDDIFSNRPLHNMPIGKHEFRLCGGLIKNEQSI